MTIRKSRRIPPDGTFSLRPTVTAIPVTCALPTTKISSTALRKRVRAGLLLI